MRGIVYVHCKIGYSRSAAVIGAWLLGRVETPDEAIALLQSIRPTIVIRPEARAALRRFAREQSPRPELQAVQS